jgi:hypothetical protein
MIKKYILKIPLTAILGISGYFCFVIPEKVIIQNEFQVTNTYKNITTIEDDGLKKFLEYIGLFLLVIAAWQWRKEVGFDSFGFISKQPDVNPTNPNDRANDEGDAPPDKTPPISSVSDSKEDVVEFKEFQRNDKLNMILGLMRENPNSITNASIIANKIGVSRNTAEMYLFELMKERLVRKDTYPGSRSSVYSLTNSLDNLAVDHFIKNNLESEEIYSDYRFVRLKSKYEIDALIKTSKTNYIIETKFLRKISTEILNKGIQQLLILEEEINLEPVSLVLLIVGSIDSIKEIQLEKLSIKENLKIYLIDKDKITAPNTW